MKGCGFDGRFAVLPENEKMNLRDTRKNFFSLPREGRGSSAEFKATEGREREVGLAHASGLHRRLARPAAASAIEALGRKLAIDVIHPRGPLFIAHYQQLTSKMMTMMTITFVIVLHFVMLWAKLSFLFFKYLFPFKKESNFGVG